MGSEDLFHKRKAKAAKDLDRRKAKRSSYDKVLIVCEGEKTEPNYFKELVAFYKLNSANVEIDGSCGSSPKSVYEKAVQLYENEITRGDSYDRVYCIFDKDTHETYESTIKDISLMEPKEVFFYVSSVPCFEYWLILHFIYTTKPYVATGSKSSGDVALKELKELMPEYNKGLKGIFSKLHDQLEFAKANASRAEQHAKANHTDNPSTNINELVSYLQSLDK
jgi:hypothetical protein